MGVARCQFHNAPQFGHKVVLRLGEHGDVIETQTIRFAPQSFLANRSLLTRDSFYILFPRKGIVGYRQIISSSLHVLLKGTCSLAGRALSNTGE